MTVTIITVWLLSSGIPDTVATSPHFANQQSCEAVLGFEMTKNCMTCGHRNGLTFTWAKCMYSGYYCEIERKTPSCCGQNFEAWTPRETVFVKLKSIFTKKTDEQPS